VTPRRHGRATPGATAALRHGARSGADPLRHCARETRYTTSAFLRVKLGEALRLRGVAPHIFESAEQARAHLRDPE